VAKTGVRVDGLDKTVRAIKDVSVELEDLEGAFSRIAELTAQSASRHAPKKTGRLAGSLRGVAEKSSAVVTVGGAAIRYAGPINYGWPARNIAPSGFMQKASDEMEPRAVSILEDEINRAISRRGLK